MLSDHNGMKLDINYRKKSRKNTDMGRLNNMLLNNQWIKEEIKQEMQNYFGINESENNFPKFIECSKSSSKREFHSKKAYLKKQENLKQPNFTL